MSYRMLVVDDTKFMRKMLSDILVQSGYEVIGEADNGKQAVELFRELRPDVVIMDITMPEMDGIEAIREIRRVDPQSVILVCSAMSQQELISDALKAGANGYLMKPFKPDRVKEVIQNSAVPAIERRHAAQNGAPAESELPDLSEVGPPLLGETASETSPQWEGLTLASPLETEVSEAPTASDGPGAVNETAASSENRKKNESSSAKIINLFRGNEPVKHFTSSYMCHWQEDWKGETTEYRVICTESENELSIQMFAGDRQQTVSLPLDSFRQLCAWVEKSLSLSATMSAPVREQVSRKADS